MPGIQEKDPEKSHAAASTTRSAAKGSARGAGPRPVDLHVGHMIRTRRRLLGLSQTELGKKVDVTFQQLQKYEKGANRVGASRLSEIAKALTVPVGYFFPDDDAEMPKTIDVAARVADIETRLKAIVQQLRQLRKLV